MSEETPQQDAPNIGHPTLTMKGGGWILIVSLVVSLLLIGWALSGVIIGKRPVGDGSNMDSYGYELSTLGVPKGSMAARGNARDFLNVYKDPQTIPGQDLIVYNQQNRKPWLVTRDRVVGVSSMGNPGHTPHDA